MQSNKLANSKNVYVLTAGLLGLAAILSGICFGSANLSLSDIFGVAGYKLFGAALPESVSDAVVSVLWEIRIPRTLCAFLVGGALSVSGAVIQAILQNPLASSYTLGVSSGASLGAALVIVTGISSVMLSVFILPVTGFVFGFGTVILVLLIASKLDAGLKNHTIILFGMVFSLFVNAIMTLVSALNKTHMQRLVLWQMGSFSGRRWIHVAILFGFSLVGLILIAFFHRELDILSFGDEEAMAVGVDVKKNKIILLILSSLLTGVSVCFVGVIGFVDLTVPHIVRRVFGASHKLVIPMSMVVGGAFMTLADLLARTLLAPEEIPVGAITALVGAPFFLWIYFVKK
jgi:iron complex transport system permease protein